MATRFWFVRSSTDPTVFYRLSTDRRGVVRCECRAAMFSRKCKHLIAVAKGDALEARPVRREPLMVAGEGFGFQAPSEEAA